MKLRGAIVGRFADDIVESRRPEIWKNKMSVKCLNHEDFETTDGSIDWDAYNKASEADRVARIANGEECHQCGKFNAWPKGCSHTCYECEDLVKK